VQVEAAMLAGARKTFSKRGYIEVTVPHLTRATGACENFDSLFDTSFFGQPAYLSQTGQLYLEAFVPSLQKTYCIGSSFRAEPKVDARHLVEFTLAEIELICNLDELKHEIETIIQGMVAETLEVAQPALDTLKASPKVPRAPFKSITYAEAVDFLHLPWGADLKNTHEMTLVQEIAQNQPLFVTHFPQEIKFFNMRENRENPKIVNSMDLLLPFGGESVGAAEREEDVDRLERRLRDSFMLERIIHRKVHKEGLWTLLSPKERKDEATRLFQWYLDFVRENPTPHAGCGIGTARVMQYILSEPDIRKTTPYPLNRETIL
jgi:asparaginyl-tRNA synthetase